MPFGVEKALQRGARRYPMTSKRGHNYYKGTGSGAMGWHTKKGGYKIDLKKVRTYVVPDLSDCKYKPYVEPDARKGIKYNISPGKYLELLRESLGLISTPKADDTAMTTTKSLSEPKEQIERPGDKPAKTELEQPKTEKIYERESLF
ncbi:7329_t:CDS:2 [Gigaspora margarita]|uniref:7329_t:CDS:1 n=2 Tax=Gigaspora margarita TaxID=4874 RepID=A0ABN7VIR0_GIGMA|nr:mitochondrial ribosomal protein L27-domain-containing protein [Gigaspora margarita]CAG8775556.1 7329_t:CDS:2 [Gigaspora margarita]